MARQLVRALCIWSALTTCLAVPLQKRWDHRDLFNGRHPLQGVEVNGLFNPMESVTPNLFERASQEHGNKLKTYRDICKLLPQEKLDSLMKDHYASFITDFNLETLKSARIDSLRIPVSYNLFIPEVNRTDTYPKGEARALDVFIDRVLDHGMTVWLDLIVTPTNQLGTLEELGNTVTPELARRVVRFISRKYHPRDVTTILVHPDIHFPSTLAKESPLNPKSIRKTKSSQYTLYRELSSILDRSGHRLAIDTTHNLDWWASKVPAFPQPLVLVHSLQTGLLSPRQYTVERLKKGIIEDLNRVKELAENVPVAITWDASINACARTETGTQDCTLNGQLWHAMDREPEQHENEETLNDHIEGLATTILTELDKAGVTAWFFRTAKLQPLDYPGQSDLDDEPLKLIKRRQPEKAVSGNDFIEMYNHGMLAKIPSGPAKGKHKIPTTVLALGAAGAAGAGALGWWFWDDFKRIGGDAVEWFHGSQEKSLPDAKPPVGQISGPPDSRSRALSPAGLPGSPPAESSHSLIRVSPHDGLRSQPPFGGLDDSLHSVWQDQPAIPTIDINLPLPKVPAPVVNVNQRSRGAPQIDKSMAAEAHLYGGPVGHPFDGYPSSPKRPAQGSVDRTKLRPVDEMIEHWETPPPSSEREPSERVEISDRGSVAASILKWETPRGSRIVTPADSRRQSGSEFQLSRGMSAKDAEAIRRLSDIQQDLKAKGVPEEDWTPAIAVPRPRRPDSSGDLGDKRHGKVISVEEKGLLDQMLLEGMRDEAKAESARESSSVDPSVQRIHVGGKAVGYSKSDAGVSIQHDVKPDIDAALEKAPSEPDRLGRPSLLDPEPLTHPQQELYTRPHAGTGESSLGATMPLAKLRKDTDEQRRPKSEPHPSPQTRHQAIADAKTRPMTVHAPRIKDLDANHPKNIKKMKSKPDQESSEYKPHPAPDTKNTVQTHHVEETKVISKSKGPFSIPKTITTHRRESMHLQPDMSTALKQAGHDVPPPPQSGIGKDPRPKFEDLHWTKEEREGHQAYIENARKDSPNVEEEEEPRRSVSELKDFWTTKERMESPKATTPPEPQVSPTGKAQGTIMFEEADQPSNENQVADSKNAEPSGMTNDDDAEEEARRVSVHEMTNFWTAKERKEAAEAARSKKFPGQKITTPNRVKASQQPAQEQTMTSSADKEDDSTPPPQTIPERVKALNEAASEKGKEETAEKEDRVPPPSAPIAERVKAFEEPPKEEKENISHKDDTNPPPLAPVDEPAKASEEEPTERKNDPAETEIHLDQALDPSIADPLTEVSLKNLQEKAKKSVEEQLDELATERLLGNTAEKAPEGPDPAIAGMDPEIQPSPKLVHLTKNRARRPAKKARPSDPST